ncbi:putative CBF/NF-Y family transcription factor [Xylona heveae TC161]|uniref:NCT transcriptional regulatory complex subunit B n=1 Tax=Xylona heveae (strain CBS 132557 / TC161) TaxID=1328760 RepID=A0A165FQ92_XYLHT|nr:putative CBF/NF-Y family transcription factor [Xylona heveae TC161]KZF21250.1 putative CBF/NF-Y family transcription factor [Xylona heveae TC161]
MSDREFGGNEDLSLPKATVQKIITEILPASSGLTFAKDARDLLIECCVEFITLVSSEANEISEKEAKKTIACEHVTKALEELGFQDYVQDVLEVANEHKEQQKTREKKQSKMEQSGLSEEELLRQQQELFRSATDKYNAGPHDSG